MSRFTPRALAVAIVLVGAVLAIDGCRNRHTGTSGAIDGAQSAEPIKGDTDAYQSVAVPPPPPPGSAACVVAYANYPEGSGPSPGDDLSSVPVPLAIPEGASLTIAVRMSGHELRIRGPAIVRPCTHEEPDVILIAAGEASAEGTTPVRPGAELFVATPAFVAVFGRATLRLRAGHAQSSWDIEDGEVTITNLDAPKTFFSKNRDALKRYEDGGVLLTRCAVQAASVASAERLLLGFAQPGQGDAAPPLPSASIGVLTAQQIKHAREKVLDCAFAEAFALSCDRIAFESDASAPGCGALGYVKVREHIARAVASGPIPPGSPPPRDAAP
jgi:hypothetical protein